MGDLWLEASLVAGLLFTPGGWRARCLRGFPISGGQQWFECLLGRQRGLRAELHGGYSTGDILPAHYLVQLPALRQVVQYIS